MNHNHIKSLIKLVETLRGENGCPWDKKQTAQAMANYLLEEVYELIEAVAAGDPNHVCEELGDVLFHIFFIARLFQEKEQFDIEDVARGITEKMIHRHPHVFGNETVSNAEEVKERWQKLKMEEKNHAPAGGSALDAVSVKMPALMRAHRISERAAATGFDWEDISGVMEKVEEEWAELKSELLPEHKIDRDRVSLEFGDVLFTLVNVARFAKIHPETALADSTRKFETRFKLMERLFSENGKTINAASHEEMENLWEEAKRLSV
jgi:tetrapyrrole methylase family protein/MazG family protein